MSRILVVNAGSTSLKLSLVDREESGPVDSLADVRAGAVEAVGHRVAHGGARLLEPTVIDDGVRGQIGALEAIAPLHNEAALRAIDEAQRLFPAVPHVAVFDTAFHATLPEEARVYALPERFTRDWGVRRFGFHGISAAWSADRASRLLARPAGLRLVVCHLGGGCSVTAIADGRSVDTTMGMTPLEGVPMATRSGSVDPGILVYLLRRAGLDPAELERILNEESGLAGMSGLSGSVRELEEQAGERPEAALALSVYVRRIAQAVAAMAVPLEGLDALVFTGGVGEGSARVRRDVCRRLSFLGVRLDEEANADAKPDVDVASRDSAVRVLALAAREELVIARAVRSLLLDRGNRGCNRP